MFHISLPTYVVVPNDCDVYDFQLRRANIIENNVQINFNRSTCLKLKIYKNYGVDVAMHAVLPPCAEGADFDGKRFDDYWWASLSKQLTFCILKLVLGCN